MSHADRPYLTRPLAGVDQALGEGRARPPVELLDRLRERLDRLDPNHPSASRRPEAAAPEKAGDLGVEAESEEGAESQESQRGDGAPARQESRNHLRQDRVGAQDGDERSDDTGADQPAASPADGWSASGSAADGEFRTVDVVRVDKGERYRPWFATDEPATPWFIE